MPSDLTVRHVRADEHDVVGRITLAAYDAVVRMDDGYRAKLADPGARVADGADVLVAVDADGRVRGSVTFVEEGNPHFENPGVADCGFRMLAVDPAAQGRGVGTALVQACVDLAGARGRRRMAIYSMATMTGAHRLYQRLGFVRRPDRDVVFPSGLGVSFALDLTEDAAAHFPPPGPVPPDPPWFEDLMTRSVPVPPTSGC